MWTGESLSFFICIIIINYIETSLKMPYKTIYGRVYNYSLFALTLQITHKKLMRSTFAEGLAKTTQGHRGKVPLNRQGYNG
jgi:hypothetical protein